MGRCCGFFEAAGTIGKEVRAMNLYQLLAPRVRHVFMLVSTLAACFALGMGFLIVTDATYAQVTPPSITSSGLNTQVSAAINVPGGKVQYDITGGTRPGNMPNLLLRLGEL
jgi:hypothetical protein